MQKISRRLQIIRTVRTKRTREAVVALLRCGFVHFVRIVRLFSTPSQFSYQASLNSERATVTETQRPANVHCRKTPNCKAGSFLRFYGVWGCGPNKFLVSGRPLAPLASASTCISGNGTRCADSRLAYAITRMAHFYTWFHVCAKASRHSSAGRLFASLRLRIM